MNFPSFRTLSAIRHADSLAKFVMCLVACDAPAAVKRKAMEPVNKVKILPVQIYFAVSLIAITKKSFTLGMWNWVSRQFIKPFIANSPKSVFCSIL
jgi:hypothetical protein